MRLVSMLRGRKSVDADELMAADRRFVERSFENLAQAKLEPISTDAQLYDLPLVSILKDELERTKEDSRDLLKLLQDGQPAEEPDDGKSVPA